MPRQLVTVARMETEPRYQAHHGMRKPFLPARGSLHENPEKVFSPWQWQLRIKCWTWRGTPHWTLRLMLPGVGERPESPAVELRVT